MSKKSLDTEIAEGLAELQELGLVEFSGEYRNGQPIFRTTQLARALEAKYPCQEELFAVAERLAAQKKSSKM